MEKLNCGSKKREYRKKEDRISSLPDYLIIKILSYLPSTAEAVKTGVLSKSWQYLWTFVPNLIFSFKVSNNDEDIDSFSKFVDSVLLLNSCSKIKKFAIEIECNTVSNDFYSRISLWIRFAVRKQVEQLILDTGNYDEYSVPQFFYNIASVIEMKIGSCRLMSENGNVINWRSLKVLCIANVFLSNQLFENITCGSPSLESLELLGCSGFDKLHVTSKCLKTLVLNSLDEDDLHELKISGAYLENFELLGHFLYDEFKFVNLPCLIHATLDFYPRRGYDSQFVKDLLLQLKHAEKLHLGSWFIEVLSSSDFANFVLPCPLSICCKCLILNVSFFTSGFSGVAVLLHRLPVLEKLIIKLSRYGGAKFVFDKEEKNLVEKYWMPYKTNSNSLTHLKTVEIEGLSARFAEYKLVLEFIEFLLKNANALEKMVIFEDNDNGTDFVPKVSQKLLSMPRSSPHAVVIFPG